MSLNMKRLFATALTAVVCTAAALSSATAQGQITDAWKNKAKWVVDTTANASDVKTPLSRFVTPIRLHTGNFDFKQAKPDGSDLRVVAADGKTILPHQIEVFDAPNELAILWVGLPTVAPNNREQFVTLHWGNPEATAPAGKAVIYGPETGTALHFTGNLENAAAGQVQIEATGTAPEGLGVTGNALKFNGAASRLVLQGPGAAISPNGATFSAWVQLAAGDTSGSVLTIEGEQANIAVALDKGVPNLSVSGKAGNGKAAGATAIQGVDYALISLVVGERVVLFVNGAEVAAVAVKVGEQAGRVTVGAGASFNLDELTISQAVRTPDWLKATVASQGVADSFIGVETEAAGEVGHFQILFDNLTLDAEIVIYILAFMFIVAAWVMVTKFIMLRKILRKNAEFLKAFNDADASVFKSGTFGAASAGAAATLSKYEDSSLYKMFVAATTQVRRRLQMAPGEERPLDSRSMNSVRAAIDSTIVEEGSRLNKAMVFLTIAISGGPFIGLLGTVIGVMITFAAIAAAGDVNVNAIAPGIAAALLATVAGLAVAIPALFGYNWLASQIKEASNQMMVFADSLQSRIAELFQKN